MPIFNGVDNIANIYHGNNQIVKVYQGANLKYELSLFGEYELIADIEVQSNTTQIDFNNLNITKDDELRLVYTFVGSSTSISALYEIYINNNNTSSNYYHQRLRGDGSSISASRNNNSIFSFAGSDRKTVGFIDIKISNNDRFVAQSQLIDRDGANLSDIGQWNFNIVGTFNTTNISKITVFNPDSNNQIAVGSRLTLYKVNTGNA